MNIVFWLLIIFALVFVWFLVMMVGVPLVRMYMKWLEKEFNETLDDNEERKENYDDEEN